MTVKERVLAAIKRGDIATPELIDRCGIPKGEVQKATHALSAAGSIVCVRGRGVRGDPKVWRIATTKPDDPTMIPGGPDPAPIAEQARIEAAFFPPDDEERIDSDDERPSADVIALAIVSAARVTGEDPLAIADPNTWLRARLPAAKALSLYYPDCTWAELGAFVGFSIKLTQRAVENALNAPWWADCGDAAFVAAVEALEVA